MGCHQINHQTLTSECFQSLTKLAHLILGSAMWQCGDVVDPDLILYFELLVFTVFLGPPCYLFPVRNIFGLLQ